MLNKEKYAKEIAEIAVNNETIALKDNKPIRCRKIKCIDCEKNVPGYGCSMKKLTEWANSECKEPILDEVEKRYLRGVIRPFKNMVVFIKKTCNYASCQWIEIAVKANKTIALPGFKNDEMYKGMKLEKEYTLEELDL